VPNLGDSQWRSFWTQQHGDNNTWEVIAAGRQGHGAGGDGNEDG
jgi:hypothetical protein